MKAKAKVELDGQELELLMRACETLRQQGTGMNGEFRKSQYLALKWKLQKAKDRFHSRAFLFLNRKYNIKKTAHK